MNKDSVPGRTGKKDAEPEILPPDGNKESGGAAVYAEIAAQINQYTDRPDLFLEVVEKHDPGFIKSMNEEARSFSRKNREARFKFGRNQSYCALGVSVIAAVVVLFCLWYSIEKGVSGFFTILSLAIFYAITQGGLRGFLKIVEGVRQAISKLRGQDPD